MRDYQSCPLLKSRWLALIVLSASLLLAFAPRCAAQESPSGVQGYVFVAPGIRTHEEFVSGLTHVGGGAELFVHKGLAAGAEFGYLRPWTAADSYEDLFMISLDASYHMPKGKKMTYFLFSGVSFSLRDRTLNNPHPYPHNGSPPYFSESLTLVNFGFGGTYWFKGRTGLRLEIRDHLYLAEADRHYLECRVALAFR